MEFPPEVLCAHLQGRLGTCASQGPPAQAGRACSWFKLPTYKHSSPDFLQFSLRIIPFPNLETWRCIATMVFCAAPAGGQHAVRGRELPSQAVLQQSRERQPWGWTGPPKPNCPLIPEAPSPPRRAEPGCQALHAHAVLPRVLSRLHGAASKPGRTIPLSHACCLPKRAPSAALPLLSFLFPLTKGFSSVLLKKKKKKPHIQLSELGFSFRPRQRQLFLLPLRSELAASLGKRH